MATTDLPKSFREIKTAEIAMSIRHVLIPFEEQDLQTQKENDILVKKAAEAAFNAFFNFPFGRTK